jgi:hypothetical protein
VYYTGLHRIQGRTAASLPLLGALAIEDPAVVPRRLSPQLVQRPAVGRPPCQLPLHVPAAVRVPALGRVAGCPVLPGSETAVFGC